MSVTPICPDRSTLRALVAGRLAADAASSLRVHAARCGPCRRALEALERNESEPTGSFEPGSRTAMETTAPAGEGVPDSEELDLAFLGPPSRRRSMGRIGAYEVLRPLGRGGMGVVFEARDATLDRTVALKVLAPRLASSRRARRRFLREARAAASINHPNVVTIHGVGVHYKTPYLVMEYIDGCTLRQRVRRAPPLTAADVQRVAHQVASGLAEAHARGVVHRDVSLGNVMLEGELERVKITDFGLARVALGISEVTSRDRIVGTPAYMSPEQVRGEPVDPRSDLFSLGCVMYAMLTGRSPFHGAHPLEVIRRVCDHHPPPLAEVAPGCPAELSAIVARLLAKDRDDRFASAPELLAALQPGLLAANATDSTESPTLPAPVATVGASAPPPAKPASRPPPPEADASPDRWTELGYRWALVALAALVLMFALARVLTPGPAGRGTSGGPGAAAARPVVRTVARAGPAAYRGVAQALAEARPGDTVRILDDGTYLGQLILDDPDRWRGVTIEAAPGTAPTLASPTGQQVILIRGTPGVTLRGLTIHPRSDQFAVRVEGRADGVRLEGLESVKPPGPSWGHVYLAPGASGSPGRPIVVRGCRLHSGGQGLLLQGDAGRAVAHVRVEGNLFLDMDQHLELLQHLSDVVVADNRFSGGRAAIWVNLPPARGARLLIAHNSFHRVEHWLHPAESDVAQDGLVVRRNAILATALEPADGLLSRMASSWRFDANLWEAGPGPASPLASRRPELAVLSRDPSSPEFLRPAPGSALLDPGGGPDVPCGARPLDRDGLALARRPRP